MTIPTFMILSATYVIALSTVDGLFNRLVFRSKRKLSYDSSYKQTLYRSWEWKAIGIIFLVFLPIILPIIAAYLIGGMQFVWYYLIVLLVIPWDVIFGKLVFDDWWGDKPSIALPGMGWLHFNLWIVLWVRFVLCLLLIISGHNLFTE